LIVATIINVKVLIIQTLIFQIFPFKFGLPITIFTSFIMSVGNLNLAAIASGSEISLSELIFEDLEIVIYLFGFWLFIFYIFNQIGVFF